MQVITESLPARTPVANPLLELRRYGQSIWLDYIRRHLITSGELARLVEEDGLCGVTSNPSIFEKAVTGSTDYDDILSTAARRGERDPLLVYELLAVRDIQGAAEVFRPLYEQLRRRDGYVSLEVSPLVAHDTQSTLEQARRLWREVGRDNVFIKVPGTKEGVPAIRQLISEGININITLLFAREMYEQVAEAHLAGLEQFAARGGDVARVASVASFFVSRIDTAVDALLTEKLRAAGGEDHSKLRWLLGKVAIANAKLAYQTYKEIVRSPRWQKLARKGAMPQRLLWASTSTKNPSYRDVIYVEELIGPDTINTMPPATMDAFRDHGRVRPSLEEDVEEAREVLETLAQVGISLPEVTQKVLDDGVRLFSESFERLISAIREKIKGTGRPATKRMSYHLPRPLAADVESTLQSWHAEGKVRRLWARDSGLWTGRDEGHWMDWLAVTEDQPAEGPRFEEVAEEIRLAGFTRAVLLGMGGSSLAPEVLSQTFGPQAGHPALLVLDSTDPDEIRAVERQIDPATTLFVVSSKSGTTLEPNILKDYFFERVRAAVGEAEAGRRFIAITDPGSKLERVAEGNAFRRLFHGVPGIGGRYSALSNFGLIPAAIMGLDVPRLLDTAEEMAQACRSCVPAEENPGVVLGVTMGVLARNGRDKVTFIASPGVAGLGAWLEQLLAESTGKDGDGVIPVDREPLGPPEVYDTDRLFVYLRLSGTPDNGQDAAVDALQRAGHPVVRITMQDAYCLGAEFFRWQIATAVASAVLGVNPFNQPDVEEAKSQARKLTAAFEEDGALPREDPILRGDGLSFFADEKNASALMYAAGADRSPRGLLKALLNRLGSGDYFALLAYVERNAFNSEQLGTMRRLVRNARRVATCGGFGPRYLHSTGQAYKGGPNTGVFLLITHEQAADLPVPGHKYTFGAVQAAQARGDFQVLAERDRRILRVHLGPDVPAGLEALTELMREAVQ